MRVENTRDSAILADLKRIEVEFSRLEAGWDGYEALPIRREAIEIAKTILQTLSHKAWVAPTADGGIQIEWPVEEGEVEVSIHVWSKGE